MMQWHEMLNIALQDLEEQIKVEPWKRQPSVLKEVKDRSGVSESLLHHWLQNENCNPKVQKVFDVIDACGFELVMVRKSTGEVI